MVLKQRRQVIIFGAFLVGLFLISLTFTQQTLFTDVFSVYFDGSTGMLDNTCLPRQGGLDGGVDLCQTKHFLIERKGAVTVLDYQDGVGLISTLDAGEKAQLAEARYKAKRSFAGFDVNVDVSHQQRQNSVVALVVEGQACEGVQGLDTPIGIGTTGGCAGGGRCEARLGRDGRARLSIDSPPTQPNNHFITFDGKEICTVSGNELSLEIDHSGKLGRLEINSIKYRQPFACEVPDGWALIEESFEGEKDLDLFSLRFFPNFCSNDPPVVLDSQFGGSEPDPRVLDALVRGETVHVNKNQVLIIRYSAPVLEQLGGKCDFANQVFDLSANACKPKNGFLQLQSDCTQVLRDGTACLSEPNAVFESEELAKQVDCKGVIIPEGDNFVCAIPLPDNVCAEGTLQADGTCPVYNPSKVQCPLGYEKACLDTECSLFDCRITLEGKNVVLAQAERGEPLQPENVLVQDRVEKKGLGLMGVVGGVLAILAVLLIIVAVVRR